MAAYRRVDDLTVTCRLTACTPGPAPGPTLGIEYEKAFTFLPFYTRKMIILCAAHTRTSILRLSIGGGHFTEPEIILPETRALFERQAQRKNKALAGSVDQTSTLK